MSVDSVCHVVSICFRRKRMDMRRKTVTQMITKQRKLITMTSMINGGRLW